MALHLSPHGRHCVALLLSPERMDTCPQMTSLTHGVSMLNFVQLYTENERIRLNDSGEQTQLRAFAMESPEVPLQSPLI